LIFHFHPVHHPHTGSVRVHGNLLCLSRVVGMRLKRKALAPRGARARGSERAATMDEGASGIRRSVRGEQRCASTVADNGPTPSLLLRQLQHEAIGARQFLTRDRIGEAHCRLLRRAVDQRIVRDDPVTAVSLLRLLIEVCSCELRLYGAIQVEVGPIVALALECIHEIARDRGRAARITISQQGGATAGKEVGKRVAHCQDDNEKQQEGSDQAS